MIALPIYIVSVLYANKILLNFCYKTVLAKLNILTLIFSLNSSWIMVILVGRITNWI